ncbi:hypothetical protein [Novosphingobium guangzhouense]|uniref:hypothetical protein n=1 Tax=Novosphingobium guangzhouense TaxID=1850347 RepID=UPI000CCBF523|nr:hypothetical protein [Novosphingobium guangzhouense]
MAKYNKTTDREPSTRKKGRAGIFIVTIVLAMALLIFVGRNIWHLEMDKQERESAAHDTSRQGH